MSDNAEAETWDLLVCQQCSHEWASPDRDESWSDQPEEEATEACPSCGSGHIVREERG